jgi:hypothetical protein
VSSSIDLFKSNPNVTILNTTDVNGTTIIGFYNSTSGTENQITFQTVITSNSNFIRFFYDQLFNLILLMLIMQMFLSIIKDFFSRKREEQENFEEYTKKNCLLCGISREKIERFYLNHKDSFEIHISHDHNINDVICYLLYLEMKNKEDLDQNIENEVRNMHKEKKFSFIPKQL